MKALRATEEALRLLAVLGDEELTSRVAWIGRTVRELVPQAHALSIWFPDEDLTLVLVEAEEVVARHLRPRAMQSSLTLRFATLTRVISAVTIYSSRADVFTARIDVVERALGAVRSGSGLDEDLAFDARWRAEMAPAQLRGRLVVDTAMGLLMGTRGFSVDEAEDWLEHTARTTGRPQLEIAGRVVDAHQPAGGESVRGRAQCPFLDED